MTFYTFANATTALPLTQLDANFATPITLGNTAVTINGTFSSIGNLTLNNATIASGNSTVTKETVTTITSPAATNLTIQSAGTTAMTIDTSQNVGIGTSSPTGKLNISTTNNSVIQLISGTTNGIRLGVDPSAGYGVIEGVDKTGTASYQPLQLGGSDVRFLISSTERMRIDSSGNLLVGTTSLTDGSRVVIRPATNQSGLTVQQNGVGDYCIHLNAVNNSGSFYYQYFVAGATNVGSISSNTTTTSYNTSSDYRLKENVASMTIGLATIAALRPVTYDWKIDGSSGEGFIAHELQEVIPHAVTGTKDAVDANGKPVYQGVDYSKIVVHLVAALQELKAEFDAYKASHA